MEAVIVDHYEGGNSALAKQGSMVVNWDPRQERIQANQLQTTEFHSSMMSGVLCAQKPYDSWNSERQKLHATGL
ncbi:hypothetical protein HYV85_01105 [Candidatus Woesearchaeota archaeon]|nr:hypothetical protein [Candidatus Woesearchaeota archaeon]